MMQNIPIRTFAEETRTPTPVTIVQRRVDTSYPAHSHDFFELELVLSGSGRQWLNSVCVPLRYGAFHLLTPGDMHRIEADEPLSFCSVKFIPELARTVGCVQNRGAYSAQLTAPEAQKAFGLLEQIRREAAEADGLSSCVITASLTLALALLFRAGQPYMPRAADTHIQLALNYIHAHFAETDLRLQTLADVCSLSVCHLSSLFRQTVGLGFSQYLCDYRLKRACALLQNSDAAITEIAFDVGFSCCSHFFRCFSNKIGCTPRQFRMRGRPRETTAPEDSLKNLLR